MKKRSMLRRLIWIFARLNGSGGGGDTSNIVGTGKVGYMVI